MDSSNNETEIRNSRYFQLRNKLQALNYYNIFGVDAIETVEQLLNDLISTTESYKQLYDKESRQSDIITQIQAQVYPLRKEVLKLNKENNELLLERESFKDLLETTEKKYFYEIKNITDELNEVKAVALYKDEEIKKNELKFDNLRNVSKNQIKLYYM